MDVILLGEIQSLIDGVNTKVQAVDTVVRGISTDIGATNATGGSTTAGTVMAKLNAIIGNTAKNNTASGTGTLSQKASWIGNTLIGATNNTGGSTTAGTVMAKLNAILTKANASTPKKTVTPSSTNIVSLATNKTYTITGSEGETTSVNSETWTKYVQYPGVYRVYCTYAFNQTAGASSDSGTLAGLTSILNVKVFHSNATYHTTHYFAKMQKGSISSTTKTIDIHVSEGDRIQIYVTNQSVGYTGGGCGPFYKGPSGTITLSDVSIRGTQNVYDGCFV